VTRGLWKLLEERHAAPHFYVISINITLNSHDVLTWVRVAPEDGSRNVSLPIPR
jgi:hypothetical protein